MDENSPSTKDTSRQSRSLPRKWAYLVLAVVLVLLIATVLLVQHFKPGFLPIIGSRTTTTPTNPAPMEGSPSLGPKDAPVTIVEYADFGCPSCEYWYKISALDRLRAHYGDKIRFIWRDYPVITLISPQAAEAGQCAYEQGKFWEFHDTVYQHDGAIEAGDLRSYASAIGLDMKIFDNCISTKRYHDRVNAEETEAFTHGYNGAPFFTINGKVVIGPQSVQVFESIIDPLLANK